MAIGDFFRSRAAKKIGSTFGAEDMRLEKGDTATANRTWIPSGAGDYDIYIFFELFRLQSVQVGGRQNRRSVVFPGAVTRGRFDCKNRTVSAKSDISHRDRRFCLSHLSFPPLQVPDRVAER